MTGPYPYCPQCAHQARGHDTFGCRRQRCGCDLPADTLSHLGAGDTTCQCKPTLRRPVVPLSRQRHACLELAAQGRSNAQIGVALHISENTVKTHLRRAYRDLKARDRAHAVTRMYELGLLQPGSGGAS